MLFAKLTIWMSLTIPCGRKYSVSTMLMVGGLVAVTVDYPGRRADREEGRTTTGAALRELGPKGANRSDGAVMFTLAGHC